MEIFVCNQQLKNCRNDVFKKNNKKHFITSAKEVVLRCISFLSLVCLPVCLTVSNCT